MNHFPVLLRELACAVRQPGPCVRALCESRCSVAVQEHDLREIPVQCNAKQTLCSHFTLRSSHPTLHSSHLHFISTHLIWALLISFHVFPSVDQPFSTHLGSSARQKPWDTDAFTLTKKSLYKILCTTKLAQSTSQYYFVLHSLHRVLPSSTLYTRLEEPPFTSSHLFVTHLNSAVCQKKLATNRISCAHTFYIVYPG